MTADQLALRYNGYHRVSDAREDPELTHTGPGTPCGEYFRRFWMPVAMTEQLGERPVLVKVLGEELVLFRDLYRTDRPAAQALQPSPCVARVRGRLRARHPVLLPRLAVRRGRRHSRGARRAGGQPHPPQALPRRLSRPGVRRSRLRLPRPPGAHARVPDARHLLSPRRRARALLPSTIRATGCRSPRTRWTRFTACSCTPG